MSGRRSRFEMYVDILTEIRNGTVLPTRIMYGTNLSWKPLKQMLKTLTAQGIIEAQSMDDGDKRTNKSYALTEKGEKVLTYFNRAKGLLELEKAVEINV